MKRIWIHGIGLVCLLLFLSASSCTFTQKIKDGEMAYDRKQYSVAVDMLEEEFKSSRKPDVRARKAYLTALSYQRMNENESSISWFKKAYDAGYGNEALHRYALALKKNQQYQSAIKVWEGLLAEDPNQKYRRELGISRQVVQWIEDQENQPYSVFRTSFNSTASDYAPAFFRGNQLVFTSDRNSATGSETYKWTGRGFSDFYSVDPNTGEVNPFSPLINTEQNEGTIAFDEEYSMMVFSRCYSMSGEQDKYCKLMVSYSQDGGWSEPVVLSFTEKEVNYAHPALSADGSLLIFASDAPDGVGGYDLYAVNHNRENWSEPVLLSERINTVGDELFPTIDRDTLYFSSDHLPGLGGLDLFKTWQRQDGSWNAPQNMLPPINSGGDDFGLIIKSSQEDYDKNLRNGYFTSSRPGGMGADDIYSFKYDPSKIQPVVQNTPEKDDTVSDKPVLMLEGKVKTPVYSEEDNPNSPRRGFESLDSVEIYIRPEEGGDWRRWTNSEGAYNDTIAYGKKYEIKASKEGYLSSNRSVSSKNLKKPSSGSQSLVADFTLDKIYLDREIVLRNIYYDYDKWNIREDAEPTLDSLSNILKWNPDIDIQLSSHTDCRGTDQYNEELSQKRAQSAVEYLISKGIDADRLSARGYGENEPAVQCPCVECTEKQYQANRRTTFKILDTNSTE